MKNLRIAVVPTETGNDIDQDSTVEEILECKETTLWEIAEYCQAQNDEELPLYYWTFLIDIDKNENLTGY